MSPLRTIRSTRWSSFIGIAAGDERRTGREHQGEGIQWVLNGARVRTDHGTLGGSWAAA